MTYPRRHSLVPFILLASLTYTYREYVKYALLVLLCLVAIKLAIKGYGFAQSITQYFALKEVDSMDGISFEHYVARVLNEHGYYNISLTEKYDYGVDIIADKDGTRWGIQVKRYSGLVKAEAVRQVVTGLNFYGCDRAMVITNSNFSQVAKKLAACNDCVLIGRSDLQRMVS